MKWTHLTPPFWIWWAFNYVFIIGLSLSANQFSVRKLSTLFFRPKVTILMTNFNKMKYLNRSIPSALRQTYSHFELLVIDDGSTDGSFNAIGRYRRTDERVRVFRNMFRRSTNIVRVMGVREARGSFLVSLDSDDALANRTLELDLQAATSYGADIVHHRAFRVRANGQMMIFWETRLGRTSNDTLVRLFRQGCINWNLWTKFISRRLYLSALRLLGHAAHRLVNAWGQDKLHCAALFRLVRLLVDVDYFAYFYYEVSESALSRSTNHWLEIRAIDEAVHHIMNLDVSEYLT
jgi:glycosyltransferase involved in cell wall biosynthesis